MAKPMFKREEEEEMHEPMNDDVETVIGPSVRVEGNFESNGDIVIEGAVNGTIKTSKDLRIGEGAMIEADIYARNINTAGKITGTVKAIETLDLKSTGKIYGEVNAGVLSVETGAVMQGTCTSGKTETAPATTVRTKKGKENEDEV